MTRNSKSLSIAITIVILLLVAFILVMYVQKNKDNTATSESSDSFPTLLGNYESDRDPFDAFHQVDESKVKSAAERFLEDHPHDVFAHLAMVYFAKGGDAKAWTLFGEEYRSQFEDHPAFALHYLSMFGSVEDSERLIETLLTKDPENNLARYCALSAMLQNGTTHPEIDELLFESVSRPIGNDYYFEIQDMGMKFATDYLKLTEVGALKYMANYHVGTVQLLDLKEYLKQRIIESQDSGDIDTSDRFAAVGFNLGTNLLRSAHNSIQIGIGIGLEGSFYQDLSESTKITFTDPNEEMFQQLRKDKNLLIEMLDTQYEYLGAASDTDYLEYHRLRREEGELEALVFVKKRSEHVVADEESDH